jgi:hypothetical protein
MLSVSLILSLIVLILAIVDAFVPGKYLLVAAVVLLAIVNLIGSLIP